MKNKDLKNLRQTTGVKRRENFVWLKKKIEVERKRKWAGARRVASDVSAPVRRKIVPPKKENRAKLKKKLEKLKKMMMMESSSAIEVGFWASNYSGWTMPPKKEKSTIAVRQVWIENDIGQWYELNMEYVTQVSSVKFQGSRIQVEGTIGAFLPSGYRKAYGPENTPATSEQEPPRYARKFRLHE